MLLKAEEETKAEYRAFAAGLCGLCPEVRAAAELAREFSRMVRERCAGALAGWLDVAAESEDDQAAGVRASELRPATGARPSSRAGVTGASVTETM